MNEVSSITNAKITGAFLGFESHGLLTAFLHLEEGCVAQSFGGYQFDYHKDGKERTSENCSDLATFVRRTLNVVGVDSWEKLEGRYCRVSRVGHTILAIGNIVEDRWFTPGEELKA